MKNWRLHILLFCFFILAAMIICRLFYIQILNHKLYQSQALGQQTGFWEIQGSRGEVFFKNSKDNDGNYGLGEEKSLAINKEKWVIFAVPKKIKDKNNFAEILSNPLQETKEFIITKLKESESYVVLKKDALLSQVTDLKNLKLEGLSFESTTARYYPQEELASQVIGFVGGNNNGQYGIEGYYDEILAGKQGVKEEKRGLNLLNFENE